MRFPFLITLKTKHYDYKYHIKNNKHYKEIGLEILKLLRNDLQWIEDPNPKRANPNLKKSLEKVFDLPYDKIEKTLKSDLRKHIKLIGKKVTYHESGYDTPRGANVVEQVANIKSNLGLSMEREEYINKSIELLNNNDTKDIWDVIYYFADDAIERTSYDN